MGESLKIIMIILESGGGKSVIIGIIRLELTSFQKRLQSSKERSATSSRRTAICIKYLIIKNKLIQSVKSRN